MSDEHKKLQVRTDLAIESKDMYTEQNQVDDQDIKGVEIKDKVVKDTKVTSVNIDTTGAIHLNKKPGSYITIYTDSVKKQDTAKQTITAEVLATELEALLEKNNIKTTDTGLVVGLGNWHVTPDALGPMTAEKILVTSHLFKLDHETVEEGYRSLASVTPGVMGVTGIETSDIIFGIVEKFKPDFVIAVDALASRSIERINETIQLSDSGIQPGSGVGNKRKELSKETLGIPVIAIGVPTVVDAATITSDTIDLILKHFGREWKEKDQAVKSLLPAGFTFNKKKYDESDLPDKHKRTAFLGMIGTLSEQEKRALITEVLSPVGHNLMVTPKEVDGFMLDMAHVLANGINASLHENVDLTNFTAYTK